MKFPVTLRIQLLAAFLAATAICVPAAAQNPSSVQLVNPQDVTKKPAPVSHPASQSSSKDLLPSAFSGWQSSNLRAGRDPAQVDGANPSLMKEYGFSDYQEGTYTRDGHKMEVKAARFADASGAYGAFTFYKQPEMLTATIGDQAATSNELVLFYRGNILVQVRLERVTEMSGAELRDLASQLPLAAGEAMNLPVLPSYLPKQAYVKNSAKYIVGPVGFNLIGSPLPLDLVNFQQGAEVATGKYVTGNGVADLVLISYPTPQIAAGRTRAIEALIAEKQKAEVRGATMDLPIDPGVNQMVRRTGPIVVYAAGQISPSEAKSLLASVNYDANVTWDEPTFLGKRDNIGNIVVGALALSGIILLFALIAGIAFGGIRILAKRLFPDRIFDRSSNVEIIRLDIGK